MKDHERLLSFKEQGEQKIATLSGEVQRLKAARTTLSKRMAKDAKGHREARQELERKITSLQRADKAAQKTIRDLEGKVASGHHLTGRDGPREHAARRRAQIAMQQRRDREDGGAAGGADAVAWFRGVVERTRRVRRGLQDLFRVKDTWLRDSPCSGKRAHV